MCWLNNWINFLDSVLLVFSGTQIVFKMKSFIVLYIIFNLYLTERFYCYDYCQIKCENQDQHVLCMPELGGEYCQSIYGDFHEIIGFTEVQKFKILDLHNQLRNTVEPPANDMMLLVWDEEMENAAQRWAEQCKYHYKQDQCRKTRFILNPERYGQNLYTLKGGKQTNETEDLDPVSVVNIWFQERFKIDDAVNIANIKKFDNQFFSKNGLTNYSQIIWASTQAIGCGYHKKVTIKDNEILYVVVCNYKWGGNINHHTIYNIGEPCSNCSKNAHCSNKNYPRICVAEKRIEVKPPTTIDHYFLSGSNTFDYCTIDCGQGTGKHTMCLYPEFGGPDCKQYVPYLEPADKKVILDMHNDLRQKVAQGKQTRQPPASNMMKLEWDDELAEVAQRWSEQCLHYASHDPCRMYHTGENVGQNVGMLKGRSNTSNTNIVKEIVQAWYNEVNDFGVIDLRAFNPDYFMSIGHFTQLAWGSTTKVGCGYNSDSNSSTYVLVCNYKIQGNTMDLPMYRVGKACSECPANTFCSKEYPGLCSLSNTRFVISLETCFQICIILCILDTFFFLRL